MYVCLCVSVFVCACVCVTQWVVSEMAEVMCGWVHMYVCTYVHTCMGTCAACMGVCQPCKHLCLLHWFLGHTFL